LATQRVRRFTELTRRRFYNLDMTIHVKAIRKLRRDARRRALALFERQRFLRTGTPAGDPGEPRPLSSPSSC
jgi:hypothetical protein